MICSNLTSILGLKCSPLNESGSIAMIDSPFSFIDGDDLPIFLEQSGGQVRFFDDGMVMLHFMGRGIQFSDKRKARFIRSAAEPHGVALNDDGVLEVWSSTAQASAGFAKYISTLLSIVDWERSQVGTDIDLAIFIDEVGMCLRSWKPNAEITEAPVYIGVTGKPYSLDFSVDGQPYIALGSHPNTISSAIKKLLDIKASPENSDLVVTAVIDDREGIDILRNDGLVVQVVAEVLPFTALSIMAQTASTHH